MKKFISPLTLADVPAIALSLLLTTLMLGVGCKTARRPVDTAGKTLASTVQTVDVAMQGYAVAVALDKVSDRDQERVRKLYVDYQAAVTVAESAIISAIRSGDTGRLGTTTAALTAARDPLLAFLAMFNKPPP